MIVEPVQSICSYDKQECWLSGINENLQYLPKYFPLISNTSLWKNRNLYYTLSTGSALTVQVNDQQGLIKSNDNVNDVCISFVYFIAPTAQLFLTLQSDDGSQSTDLFQVDGRRPITLSTNGPVSSGFNLLSGKQTLCLKTLIDIDQVKQWMGESWKIVFKSKISNPFDTVAVEIVKCYRFQVLFL